MSFAASTSTVLDNSVDDFVLVWLDTRTSQTITAEESHNETIKRQSQLQTIINFTRTFNDVDDCRTFIQSRTTEKVFLIACGYLGESFVPIVHDLPQLEVVYIFCIDHRKHAIWTKPYDKVRAVCTTTNELLKMLSQDVSMHSKNLTPLSIFSTDLSKEISLRLLKTDGKRFMWFQLLLELLLRIPTNEVARSDMKHECEQAYYGNTIELKRIDDFFRTYTPDNCIQWYTKDSFIYRLLNKAFRTENIDIIFKFRFFIIDLYRQLKQLHKPLNGTFFSGQTMSNEELEKLKNGKGKLVSINTFLSTTKSSNHATQFSGNENSLPKLQSVVFQVDVDEQVTDTQPFADVTHISSMPQEDEVLFSMNTIFRLIDVEECGSIWIIYLALENKNEQDLNALLNHFMKEINKDQVPPILMLGEFLQKMGDYGRASRYYNMVLKELSTDNKLIGKIYSNMGLVAVEGGNFLLAMRNFNKAISIQKSAETLDLAETYSNIALLYDQQGETDKALDYNIRCLDIRTRLLHRNHPLLGEIYNNIGLVYFHRREYEKALDHYEKAHLIQQTTLESPDHFDHAITLNNIGLVYYEQGKYELALSFYKQAQSTQERSLPAQHPDNATIYTNIGSAQKELDHLDEALIMFEKALEVRLTALLPHHPSISEAFNNLGYVLDALDKTDAALENYHTALKYCQGTSPDALGMRAMILNNIGEIFSYQEDYDKAKNIIKQHYVYV